VFLLPLMVVAMVAAHVLLVRRHGVVPPFQIATRTPGAAGGTPETIASTPGDPAAAPADEPPSAEAAPS
jgi:quinol-cytochrome oxidoreductase complex cytochrome b subunit